MVDQKTACFIRGKRHIRAIQGLRMRFVAETHITLLFLS